MAESANDTPQPRRRLGLRLRKGASTTPGLRRQPLQQTPSVSEGNITDVEKDAIETPRALPLKLKSNTTSCRRLGLSRKRKDLSKKRLEFAVAADPIDAAPKEADQKKSEETHSNNWRQRKILELEADIEIWRNGFVSAVEDLQAMANPRVPKETLLAQLGIPLEMLQYLDED